MKHIYVKMFNTVNWISVGSRLYKFSSFFLFDGQFEEDGASLEPQWAIAAHGLEELFEYVFKKFGQIESVMVFSDTASKDFRCCQFFFLCSLLATKMKSKILKGILIQFFERLHGKNPCDPEFARIKQCADKSIKHDRLKLKNKTNKARIDSSKPLVNELRKRGFDKPRKDSQLDYRRLILGTPSDIKTLDADKIKTLPATKQYDSYLFEPEKLGCCQRRIEPCACNNCVSRDFGNCLLSKLTGGEYEKVEFKTKPGFRINKNGKISKAAVLKRKKASEKNVKKRKSTRIKRQKKN